MDGPQPDDPPNPPVDVRTTILAYWQVFTDSLAGVPIYWQSFKAWCGVKKRSWIYTQPMKVVGPLGVRYTHLEKFYGYGSAFLLVYTVLPLIVILCWFLLGFACTWRPSRQHLPQDLCFLPGFQPNGSSWPVDRFYRTNGSEQGAAKYLESVMVGPTALADHTVAVRQQRKKIEKSPHALGKHLPENLMEIETQLREFNPKFERFSLSLCNALDDIDHGFWSFVHIFDKYTASTSDLPSMSWSSLVFYPWNHAVRLLNSNLNVSYLPTYRAYPSWTAGETIYEFNRFYVRSMNALDDMNRDFLARDLPQFLGRMKPLLETNHLLLTADRHHIDWQRDEAFKSFPLHQKLFHRLGWESKNLNSLDQYRALYDRNGNRLRNIEDALHTWGTYLAQLREQLLSLNHLFQRRTTLVDLLFQRPGSVLGLMTELQSLRRENRTLVSAGEVRFPNVMHFNMQIGRLHDMIAGVSAGREEGSCAAQMQRARTAYSKAIGNDVASVVKVLLKAHEDFKKGKPLPNYWGGELFN